MKVIALDPGKTTGVCFATYLDNKIALSVDQQEISLAAMWAMLSNACQNLDDLHIIYEDFTYRNASRTGLDLTPVKLIGIIEVFREWHEPLIGFYKQTASTGKAFYNDDRLKALDVYARGKQHGRDASRHFLQWATFGAGSQWINMDNVEMVLI